MVRSLLILLSVYFCSCTSFAQNEPQSVLPDSKQEIVDWVKEGHVSWLDQSDDRIAVLIAFIQTKHADLPELPNSSWEEWLATQQGVKVIDAYSELAVFHSRKGELELALSHLAQAEKELGRSTHKDSIWYSKQTEVLDAKAEVLWMAGKPLLAVDALSQALNFNRPADLPLSPQTRSRLNNNMGIVQWNLGEMDLALQHFELALETYNQLYGSEHPKTGRCHNNTGVVLLHLGDLGQARLRFESALNIAEKDKDSYSLRSMIHNNLGVISLSENTPEKALVHFERSQKELEDGNVGVAQNQMDIWRFKAEAYAALQDTTAALQALNKAIEFTSGVDGELGVHAAELYVLRSKLQPKERLTTLLDAEYRMRNEGITQHPDYAKVLQSIGRCYMDQDQLDSSKNWLDRGHAIYLHKLQTEQTDKGIIASYANLAKWSYLSQGELNLAQVYWDSSLYYMDYLRARTPYPDSRNNFFKVGDEVYPEALSEAYSKYDEVQVVAPKAAAFIFKCIEHSKSFTFSQHILDQRMFSMTEEGRRKRSILSEYNFIRSQVNQLPVGTPEERSMRQRLNELSSKLKATGNASVPLQQYAPPALELVQANLRAKEIYLSFYSGNSRTYAIASSRDQSIAWNIPTDTLETLLAKQRKSLWKLEFLKSPEASNDLQNVLSDLYLMLIAPVMAHFNPEKVLISPHGKVSEINVNSLVRELKPGPIHDWEYLVHSIDLSRITSSWQLVHRLKELHPRAMTAGIWASDYDRQNILSRLPNTIAEAEMVANKIQSKLFLNTDCSREQFLNEAANFDVLHLALHGSSGSLTSEGCLYFEVEDTVQALKLSELMAFGLSNPLTVLGSCEGGQGNWTAGETTNSLSKAFLTAGSHQVLHSQWALEDGVHAEIISRFYTELNHGHTPSEALSRAQSSYLREIEDPLYAHPHFWSGIELNGPDPLAVTGSTELISWETGLGMTLLILLLGIYLLRTRR